MCTQHVCTKKNTLFKLLQILTDENRVVRPALDLMTVRLLANLCGVRSANLALALPLTSS